MQDQGDVVSGLVDAVQSLEVQTLPVGRVDTVDVADAGCQEVDAQIGDLCALRRICDLASAHDAVLDAADGTDLSFDAQALGMCQSDQLLGLLHVLFNGVVAAVEHDGRETGFHAGLAAFVGAVVQMQSNGNGDPHGIDHCADHRSNGLETGHVLTGTLGDAQDDRALHLLAGGQHSLGPLQVVDVELGHTVVAVACLDEHFGCIYQHYSLPPQIHIIGVKSRLRMRLCVSLNEPVRLVYPKQTIKSIQIFNMVSRSSK